MRNCNFVLNLYSIFDLKLIKKTILLFNIIITQWFRVAASINTDAAILNQQLYILNLDLDLKRTSSFPVRFAGLVDTCHII